MKKILSLVISGIVASSLTVGCSNKETAKETVIIKYQNENGNTIKEKEVTKEEAQEIKEQNKSKEIKKEANNKSEVKKESKTYQQSKENKENTTKKDNSDNKTDETNTDKSKKTTKGYWVTCPKGHKIWTINGDWNCNKCEEEYEKEQEKEQERKELAVNYVKCPNCGNAIQVNEYGNGTCNGCGLNYFPGCIKKGTELDKVEHEEENQSDDIVEEQNQN